MHSIKTHVCYNLKDVGNAVVTKQIPQWLFESNRFGHTITMKASVVSTPNQQVLYGKCSEIRDVSDTIDTLGEVGLGFVYLATDSMSNTPEYTLSRIPREISFLVRELNSLPTTVNALIWLEFTFTPETKDYVGSYMPLHNGPVY